MRLSGSKIIIESLLEQGVDTVFGYPGGAIMPLYDALYDAHLHHVLTVHEQGAVHAADGYARASGKVGVCIATSGPGATNLVTGLATAYLDSSPVVAITGQVSTALLGRDAFQEIDITGITMPVTKHNFLVKDVNCLADVIHKAFVIAASGRPGPVLIDVPKDVLLDTADYCPGIRTAKPDLDNKQQAEYERDAINAAAKLITTAERPVMMIGGGVKAAGAEAEALALALRTGMPIVSTLMGLGAFPSDHHRYLGLTGMHGHKAANLAVHEADVVIAVGTRFSDRVTSDPYTYSSGKAIIHLDVDPAEFDKNIAADVTITGHLRTSLSLLTELLPHSEKRLAAWWERIAGWKQEEPDTQTDVLTPPWMMQYMSDVTASLPVTWVTDVGQHQMWAAQHLKLYSSRAWITSGGLGTMGFGMPAALGAQLSCPDRRVILLAGDGGFKMTGMELFTAVNEGLPLICVVINNNALGMVRQWQRLFFNGRYSATTLPDFDFAGFVKACGAQASSAATVSEFKQAFTEALAMNKPTVVVANISPELMVSPMVSPGQPINRFVE